MGKLLVVLAVTSMALAATTYTFWRDREIERARADALQARITALETRRPEKPVLQPTQSNVPVSTAPKAPTPQPATDIPGADSDSSDEYLALRRRLLRDPKYYEAWRTSARLNFAGRRDEIVRELGISPAKADEMVEYWIDRRLRIDTFPFNPSATEQEQLAQQEQLGRLVREDEEKWRAIVGNEVFGKVRHYEDSRPSRYQANQLRIRLASGSDPLRDDQFEPLIGALHTEQLRLQQEVQDFAATLDPEGASAQDQQKAQQRLMDLHAESKRRIHSAASATLSSRQLAALDAMLRAQFEQFRASSILNSMEANASEN